MSERVLRSESATRLGVVAMSSLVAVAVIVALSAFRQYRHVDGPLLVPISSGHGLHATDVVVLASVFALAWFVTGLRSAPPAAAAGATTSTPRRASQAPPAGRRLRRLLSTGVSDAALASAATLLCGLYAARYLEAVELGVYGLFFSGFVVAAIVPAQLICGPVEVELLSWEPRAQLASLRQTLPVAAVVGAASTVVVFGIIVATTPPFEEAVAFPILSTAFAATVLSPLQDHARRLLHQVEASERAALVSAVQFGVVVVSLVVFSVLSVDRVWVPFGALALANVVSLTVAVLLADARRVRRSYELRSLLGFGGWLLYAHGVERLAAFSGLLIVARLAGLAEVGGFEAARVFSQPVLVLATGLLAVLRPRAMRAAQQRDEGAARRASTVFAAAVMVTAVLYLAVVGPEWAWSPIGDLFPVAYSIGGLLPLMIVSTAATTMTLIHRSQVVGARREKAFAGLSTAMSALQIIVIAVLVVPLGAIAIPIGVLAKAVVSYVGLRRLLLPVYRPAPV